MMMRRTYGSRSPSIRDQADQALTSDDCSKSSAATQSPVSRYALRSSRVDRPTTNSSKPSTGTVAASPLQFVAEYYQQGSGSGCLLAPNLQRSKIE